jgi:hypothetical protein
LGRGPFGDGRTVERLPQLIGPDRAVPDFSTVSRRRKTRKANVPCRCAPPVRANRRGMPPDLPDPILPDPILPDPIPPGQAIARAAPSRAPRAPSTPAGAAAAGLARPHRRHGH